MADLAWAAGVLDMRAYWTVEVRDADGRRPRDFDGRTWRSWRPLIGYRNRSNKDEAAAIQDLLFDAIGVGHVSRPKHNKGRRGWFATGATACAEVNRLLLPYLKVKGRKAQLHLELCERIIDWKPESFEQRSLSREEIERRLELHAAIHR